MADIPSGKADAAALRYAVTLIANVVRAVVSFLAGLIVARTLGAGTYGDLTFLLGSFAAISQLLEMGSSSAFYTFLARRARRPAFLVLYGTWLLVQFLLPAIVVLAASPRLVTTVWQGQGRTLILLCWLSSFLSNQLWGAISQLGEAVRRTRVVQTASVLQAIAHVAAVSTLAWAGWLTIRTFFWLTAIEYGLLAVALAPSMVAANTQAGSVPESSRAVLSAFAGYCRPLIVYGWAGFLYLFADRWLLQHFGGAVQQGYLGIGQQFAAISLLATTSALKVFWKEIADASERGDTARIQSLYGRVTESLYAIGAWTSCLVLPYTRELLVWTVGSSYAGASVTLMLLLFFPIHQSLGQVQGSFFFASGDTRTYTRLGLLWMALSIPVTFLLLAPASHVVPGLGLGSLGLAIKLVVLNVIAVNVQGYVIARRNGWPFYVRDQVLVPLILVAVAYGSKAGALLIVSASTLAVPDVITVVLGCLLYVPSSVAGLMRFVPSVRGGLADVRRFVAAGVGGGFQRQLPGPAPRQSR